MVDTQETVLLFGQIDQLVGFFRGGDEWFLDDDYMFRLGVRLRRGTASPGGWDTVFPVLQRQFREFEMGGWRCGNDDNVD